MHGLVYEYEVDPALVAGFEATYGPTGEWARFFQAGSGYLGTELLRDSARPGRYLLIDRWISGEAAARFLADHAAEYARRSSDTAHLYLREARLGDLRRRDDHRWSWRVLTRMCSAWPRAPLWRRDRLEERWSGGRRWLARGLVCAQGRQGLWHVREPRSRGHRVRRSFCQGRYADVFLWRSGVVRGYAVAIWKHGHVAEPTQLPGDQAAGFWLETLRAGAAIERHLRPVKLNYLTLGNVLPHLHTHIVARYDDDPAPGGPLPFAFLDEGDTARGAAPRRRAGASSDHRDRPSETVSARTSKKA